MILDSGERMSFKSGAVRDIKKGRGRCDLLPLDIVYRFFKDKEYDDILIMVLDCLRKFEKTKDIIYLYRILNNALAEYMFYDEYSMFLELSIHFEEGAEKYGIDNWKKGIPEWSYLDSAIRHFLKWARGDNDERHDRAFVWNIVCLIWTVENKADEQ